jgi:hypothetical protein
MRTFENQFSFGLIRGAAFGDYLKSIIIRTNLGCRVLGEGENVTTD